MQQFNYIAFSQTHTCIVSMCFLWVSVFVWMMGACSQLYSQWISLNAPRQCYGSRESSAAHELARSSAQSDLARPLTYITGLRASFTVWRRTGIHNQPYSSTSSLFPEESQRKSLKRSDDFPRLVNCARMWEFTGVQKFRKEINTNKIIQIIKN